MGERRPATSADESAAPVRFKIRKGLDLPLPGRPAPVLEPGPVTASVALLARDYPGLRPRLHVQPGDSVGPGQVLFTDKRDERIRFTAPARGTVVEVNRGARRALQSVVIDLDEAATADPAPLLYPGTTSPAPHTLTPAAVRERLQECGLWTALRTRPYGHVPLPDSEPHAIFVTAIDTRPLAADPAVIVAPHAEAFDAGLAVLARLTAGRVYLCTAPRWSGPRGDGTPQVLHATFEGPHPAGLPGTHIHHLYPVAASRCVWYVGCQDVIAIGRLFTEGRLWLERMVALGGEAFRRPRILRTRLGARVGRLVQDELIADAHARASHRVVSGCVLDGHAAVGVEDYLGRYHQQISVLAADTQRRPFGWSTMLLRIASYASPLKPMLPGRRRPTTSLHGEPTAMIPIPAFERLIPLDVLPIPLLRALLIRDTVTAQALGCLELEPEDLALCTFLCPGKNDYGAVLRVTLDHIEREG